MKITLKTGLAMSFASLVTLLSLPTASHATAYASKLANSGTFISFTLNEPASYVKIITSTTTNNVGARPKGSNSVSLAIVGAYQVQVISSNAPGYFQSSADANILNVFNSPRGVIINTNPASANFGRIYVANSAIGTVSGRTLGQGIYILNADQSDALGRGNTASVGNVAYAVTASSPYRIGLGQDDGNLYVNAFGTADATTWAYDPDVTAATNIFPEAGETLNPSVHGDAAGTPIVTGSLAAGNLTLYNTDGTNTGHYNWLMRWDIGSSLPYNTPPTPVCRTPISSNPDLVVDVEIGPTGNFYEIVNRSAGTDASSLRVYDANATTILWDSLPLLGSPDPMLQARGLAMSADHKIIATIHDNNHLTVLKLTNGVPDWSSRVLINQTPTTTIGRDIGFDVAGNIYSLSSGQSLLRVWSAGGLYVATTGSSGTFDLFAPASVVSVSAPDPSANEAGPDTGTFTISRAGDTSSPLTVNYIMRGTASNGVDYVTLPGSATILANSSSVDVTLTPIQDGVSEFLETAIMTISASTNYGLDIQTNATISIIDPDPTQLVLGTVQPTMYERFSSDSIVFQVLRKGDTNTAVTANILYSGTATNGVQYTANTATVDLAAGAVTANFTVSSPVDDLIYTSNHTVIATLDAGSGYSIGSPASATGTIIDDEVPTETILFADSLTDDTSTNWNVKFGSNNSLDDYSVIFASSLSGALVPATPTGADSALQITVNKSEATAGGAAGINLYPTNKTFSGDYAVRFSMLLAQGSATTTASEYATFGINHSGNATNWVLESAFNALNSTHLPFGGDGVWSAILADGSGSAPGDYSLISGAYNSTNLVTLASASAASEAGIFKKPLFNVVGCPATVASAPQATWVDVELKTVGGVITMSIDKTPILTYTNATGFNAGNIMLGYMDSYDSIGLIGSVYFSNLRVVSLASGVVTTPVITKAAKAGAVVTLNYTGGAADSTNAFHVQSSATVNGPYTDDATATNSLLSAGFFQSTVSVTTTNRFYRIRR